MSDNFEKAIIHMGDQVRELLSTYQTALERAYSDMDKLKITLSINLEPVMQAVHVETKISFATSAKVKDSIAGSVSTEPTLFNMKSLKELAVESIKRKDEKLKGEQ